jgi:hypothetical protein
VISGSTATSYYYAGSVRVAMRQGSTLSYLFADQLGSTSVVANSSGSKTAEVRYKAWWRGPLHLGDSPERLLIYRAGIKLCHDFSKRTLWLKGRSMIFLASHPE